MLAPAAVGAGGVGHELPPAAVVCWRCCQGTAAPARAAATPGCWQQWGTAEPTAAWACCKRGGNTPLKCVAITAGPVHAGGIPCSRASLVKPGNSTRTRPCCPFLSTSELGQYQMFAQWVQIHHSLLTYVLMLLRGCILPLCCCWANTTADQASSVLVDLFLWLQTFLGLTTTNCAPRQVKDIIRSKGRDSLARVAKLPVLRCKAASLHASVL